MQPKIPEKIKGRFCTHQQLGLAQRAPVDSTGPAATKASKFASAKASVQPMSKKELKELLE